MAYKWTWSWEMMEDDVKRDFFSFLENYELYLKLEKGCANANFEKRRKNHAKSMSFGRSA